MCQIQSRFMHVNLFCWCFVTLQQNFNNILAPFDVQAAVRWQRIFHYIKELTTSMPQTVLPKPQHLFSPLNAINEKGFSCIQTEEEILLWGINNRSLFVPSRSQQGARRIQKCCKKQTWKRRRRNELAICIYFAIFRLGGEWSRSWERMLS